MQANPGEWNGNPDPDGFTYEWYTIDRAGVSTLVGTGKTYTSKTDDGGKWLQNRVTATNGPASVPPLAE